MTERDDVAALRDILAAIHAVQEYRPSSRTRFEEFEPFQSHYIRYLIQIGEAATRLSTHLRNAHSDLPWSEIIGMRNILAHDYERVDLDELWRTVEEDLPPLRRGVERILAEVDSDDP